jgi:acetyl esterase/lipase
VENMKRWFYLIVCAVTASALVGCSMAIQHAIATTHANDTELNLRADRLYDREHSLKLDVYSGPNKGAPRPRPVIVFFYGGGWTDGNKEASKFVADPLVLENFVVVIPDYRKHPEVKFPEFMVDAAKAVSWTKSNIDRYGGDPDNIFILGHSAGAHIGALLLADKEYLMRNGLNPDTAIRGFAGLAGPYSFTPEEKPYTEIFGPKQRYPQMQVDRFITGKEPPMLLLHGDDDTLVGVENLQKLRNAIQSKGGRVETRIYPNIGHIEIVGAFTKLWRDKAPVIQDVSRFFHRHVVRSNKKAVDLSRRPR